MSTKAYNTQKSLAILEDIAQKPLTLGALIWAIRRGEGWTQVELARKLGMSRQQLCDIEHDRKGVSPKLASRYAKQLGYSQEQFVRLALQHQVSQAGLKLSVEVTPQKDHTTHARP